MHIIALFTTLLIHWVAYFGVYKLNLANDQKNIRELLLNRRTQAEIIPVVDNPPLIEEAKVSKEHISILKEPKKPSEDNIYYKELERLCSDQKIYRDSTLDRNKVAEILGISPSYVSQLINSITGENFSTYINRYRVEEVKNLLLDKEFDNYSLLSIGLECGFSSKTTYFNWFKKITGTTPNTFRKIKK
jgi:YesN/AraC family two-component response regulator